MATGHYWTQNFGTRSAIDPLVVDREAYSTSTLRGDAVPLQLDRRDRDALLERRHELVGVDAVRREHAVAGQRRGGTFATVRSQIRNGGTVRSAQDSIRLANACGGAGGEPPLFANGME